MRYLKKFKLNEGVPVDIQTQEIENIKSSIKETEERIMFLKKKASDDPFGDNYDSLKAEFQDAKEYLDELKEDLESQNRQYIGTIAKLPFKYSTKEELKDSLEKVAVAIGYTQEELNNPNRVYQKAKYDAREADGINAYGLISIPSKYSNYRIRIKDKKMIAKPSEKHYFGMIPDGESYAQYGTSGQNNPAPTSNMNKVWDVNTIGDVAGACVEMMVIPKKTSAAEAKSFAEYLRAGGRDWD